MAERLSEWVKINMPEIKRLTRQGVLNSSLLNRYNIFIHYDSLKEPSKMKRYQYTADAMNTSVDTVIRAVKSMQQSL